MNYSIIKKLSTVTEDIIIISLNNIILYDLCSMTKATQKVLQRFMTKVMKPLKFIHIDLISPITLMMISKWYYIVFKNDYNKIFKIYSLKFKDQIYDWYIKFKTLIKNHLKFIIKCLQINSDIKYNNGQFITILKTLKIQ